MENANSLEIIGQSSLYKSTSTQMNVIFLCIKFHQNGKGGVEKTKYFSKKMLSSGVITPRKIIGQGSFYNIHIYIM
jgi:hypothetical protein